MCIEQVTDFRQKAHAQERRPSETEKNQSIKKKKNPDKEKKPYTKVFCN